jgi:hypothetical protein
LNLGSIGQHIIGVKEGKTFWIWHIRCKIDWWEIFKRTIYSAEDQIIGHDVLWLNGVIYGGHFTDKG